LNSLGNLHNRPPFLRFAVYIFLKRIRAPMAIKISSLVIAICFLERN
jgi:hypothetical protein